MTIEPIMMWEATMSSVRLTGRLTSLAATVALLAACASVPKPPPPIADLSSAHALVSQAEQSGAQTYDDSDLVAAQQELQRADGAATDRPAAAARLAQEASVDAQLAMARTRATQEQNALHQVNENLAALRTVAGDNPAVPPSEDETPPAPLPAPAPATGGPQP